MTRERNSPNSRHEPSPLHPFLELRTKTVQAANKLKQRLQQLGHREELGQETKEMKQLTSELQAAGDEAQTALTTTQTLSLDQGNEFGEDRKRYLMGVAENMLNTFLDNSTDRPQDWPWVKFLARDELNERFEDGASKYRGIQWHYDQWQEQDVERSQQYLDKLRSLGQQVATQVPPDITRDEWDTLEILTSHLAQQSERIPEERKRELHEYDIHADTLKREIEESLDRWAGFVDEHPALVSKPPLVFHRGLFEAVNETKRWEYRMDDICKERQELDQIFGDLNKLIVPPGYEIQIIDHTRIQGSRRTDVMLALAPTGIFEHGVVLTQDDESKCFLLSPQIIDGEFQGFALLAQHGQVIPNDFQSVFPQQRPFHIDQQRILTDDMFAIFEHARSLRASDDLFSLIRDLRKFNLYAELANKMIIPEGWELHVDDSTRVYPNGHIGRAGIDINLVFAPSGSLPEGIEREADMGEETYTINLQIVKGSPEFGWVQRSAVKDRSRQTPQELSKAFNNAIAKFWNSESQLLSFEETLGLHRLFDARRYFKDTLNGAFPSTMQYRPPLLEALIVVPDDEFNRFIGTRPRSAQDQTEVPRGSAAYIAQLGATLIPEKLEQIIQSYNTHDKLPQMQAKLILLEETLHHYTRIFSPNDPLLVDRVGFTKCNTEIAHMRIPPPASISRGHILETHAGNDNNMLADIPELEGNQEAILTEHATKLLTYLLAVNSHDKFFQDYPLMLFTRFDDQRKLTGQAAIKPTKQLQEKLVETFISGDTNLLNIKIPDESQPGQTINLLEWLSDVHMGKILLIRTNLTGNPKIDSFSYEDIIDDLIS